MGTMSSLGRITTMSICLSMLGGCATSSLFQSYPSQAESFQHVISLNSPEQDVIKLAVLEDLNEERESADAMLYMMERGRINQLNASFADSKTDFELVIAGFEEQDLETNKEIDANIK